MPQPSARRVRLPHRDDAGRDLPPRIHRWRVLRAATHVVSGERCIPLHRYHAQTGGAPAHNNDDVPVPSLPPLPLRREPRAGQDLVLYPSCTGPAAELRADVSS